MRFSFTLSAAIAAFLAGASVASADDMGTGSDVPAAKTKLAEKPRVLVLGDGVARFTVERDPVAGRMTFRLADPATKLACPPAVVMTTDAGAKEIRLTPVEGQTGTWAWSDDAVKAERFDGSLRVFVDGKPYTSPLASVWTAQEAPQALDAPMALTARYGGHVLALSDCGASVEVVQDLAAGSLTVYSFEGFLVAEAPVVTITKPEGATNVTLTKLAGVSGAWTAKHDTFKIATTATERIRMTINAKTCEAALVYSTARGGQMVPVTGGPSFEVVRDPKAGYYTFYAVDDTWNGKAYTVENPTMLVGGRTYDLTRVDGEPRAWRLAGLDAAGSDARDGQLNFTLLGKTLSTRVGLSGLGVDVK